MADQALAQSRTLSRSKHMTKFFRPTVWKVVTLIRSWALNESYFARRRAVARIAEWNDRDEKALAFYSQFVRSGQLCFDIGANRGNRTKIFQRIGGRVVALEPQRHCVRILRAAFSSDPRVTIIEAACGERQGDAEILIATADTVSSLATGWVDAVKSTGRFGSIDWVRKRECKVTTLDFLIGEYGVPVFIKIDVEGSELNVLRGLSTPVPCLSFEFTPEFVAGATDCIRYLVSIGLREFNLSLGESMELLRRHWVGPDEIVSQLLAYKTSTSIFGDVYARLPGRIATQGAGIA